MAVNNSGSASSLLNSRRCCCVEKPASWSSRMNSGSCQNDSVSAGAKLSRILRDVRSVGIRTVSSKLVGWPAWLSQTSSIAQ